MTDRRVLLEPRQHGRRSLPVRRRQWRDNAPDRHSRVGGRLLQLLARRFDGRLSADVPEPGPGDRRDFRHRCSQSNYIAIDFFWRESTLTIARRFAL